MPLKQGSSEKTKKYNINKLIEERYNPKQAVAIAYSIQRKNDADERPEYLGTIVEFAEGDANDHFHKYVVGKLYNRNELPKLNQALEGYNELVKGKQGFRGYNKVYFDHIIRYDGHKYKFHYGRFDAGSDGRGTVISERDIPTILKEFERVKQNDVLRRITALDSMPQHVVGEYYKVEGSNLIVARLVAHNNGYTFMSSNASEDKDFNQLAAAENYIISKKYKKQG